MAAIEVWADVSAGPATVGAAVEWAIRGALQLTPEERAESDRAMTALEVALDLAANRGIPVFPCKADKTPATPRGFKNATTDLDQIERWFANGDHLVAVPTGAVSGLVVADVDPAGAGWYHENAARLGCGCVNRTRRGHHLVYRANGTSVPCSAGKAAPGVDIRGEGGYIIYWPAHGLTQTGGLDELTDMPAWLTDACVATPQKEIPASGKIREGGRNDTLSRLAYKLRKAAGLDVEAIAAALHEHNAKHCSPPLPRDEVETIARGKERIAPDEEPEGDEPFFLTADLLRGGDFPTPAPIVDGLLLIGASLLHGPAKWGKSWFLLQLGLAIDGGASFLGRPTERRACLYVGAEDSSARFKSRLERMFAFGSLKFMNRKSLDRFAKRLKLALGDEPMTVRYAVKALWEAAGRPSVIFIDTQEVFEVLLGIAHGKPGDSITRRDYQATSSYDGLALELGIALVLVGHWGEIKSIEKATSNPHECINTTKARLAGVTTSITLGPLPNQEPGVATRDMQLSIRSRDLVGGDQFLWLKQDEMTGAYECLGTVHEVQVTDSQGQLFGALMDARSTHGADHWMTAAEIAGELDCSIQAVKQMAARVRKAAKAKGRKAMYQGFELESKPNKGYRLK